MPQKTYLSSLVSGSTAKRVGCYSPTNPTGMPCSSSSYQVTSVSSSNTLCICTSSCIKGPFTYNYNQCGYGNPFQVYWSSDYANACCFQNGLPIQCPSCIWQPGQPCYIHEPPPPPPVDLGYMG